MSFTNTIGTSMLQSMIVFQFIVIGLYSLYLHFFKQQLQQALHPSNADKGPVGRLLQRMFRRGLSLALLRGLDLCTPAVFLLCHSLIFVSAADSSYTACGLLVLAFALPFKFFDAARDAAADISPDEAAEARMGRSLMLARVGVFVLLVVLYFFAPIARLEVDASIAKLINETETSGPRVPSIDLPRWQLLLLFVLLLAPKRLSRRWYSALVCAPVLAGYFCIAFLWKIEQQGEPGSFEYAFTTVMRYSLREWGGQLLVHIAVVFSALVWIVNPLWEAQCVPQAQSVEPVDEAPMEVETV